HVIEHNLAINTIGLHAARANLKQSQKALMSRLRTIYQSREDQSTLAVLLGAQSIDDLVNRIETVQSVSSQDVAVMDQVISFKHQVTAHQHALVRPRHEQKQLVAQRAAAKARIGSQLGRQQRLLASIKGEIAHILAQQQARQLALKRAALARYTTAQQQQALALQDTVVGASATTSD